MLNYVLHLLAIIRLRHADTEARIFYKRTLAEGKSPRKRSGHRTSPQRA
jgi:hypothetical protein